jgi:hypothetical protein
MQRCRVPLSKDRIWIKASVRGKRYGSVSTARVKAQPVASRKRVAQSRGVPCQPEGFLILRSRVECWRRTSNPRASCSCTQGLRSDRARLVCNLSSAGRNTSTFRAAPCCDLVLLWPKTDRRFQIKSKSGVVIGRYAFDRYGPCQSGFSQTLIASAQALLDHAKQLPVAILILKHTCRFLGGFFLGLGEVRRSTRRYHRDPAPMHCAGRIRLGRRPTFRS